MAFRIRYAYPPGFSLGYSIERLIDGLYYDFADSTFKATATTPVNALSVLAGNYVGLYRDTVTSTPQAQFTNGEYSVNIHNMASANAIVGLLGMTMYNGDSAPVFSAGGAVAGGDPWATPLPGAYPTGTAGAILARNLDVAVSSRSTFAGGIVAGVASPVNVGTILDKTGYTLTSSEHTSISADVASGLTYQGYTNVRASRLDSLDAAVSSRLAGLAYVTPPTAAQIASGVWEEPRTSHTTLSTFGSMLDAAITSRSTYAGGPVASVTAPVTVGTISDKTGFSLAASGLDAISVETGVNARQALSPILAAAAGTLVGAGTGTIVVKGGNVAATRITATTDNVGNRTTVSLTLPT